MSFVNLDQVLTLVLHSLSLCLLVFSYQREAYFFEFEDSNFESFLLRILLDVKNPLKGLNPFKVVIWIQSSLKFCGINSHVPQVISSG